MHVLRRHDAKSLKSYANIGVGAHGISQWRGVWRGGQVEGSAGAGAGAGGSAAGAGAAAGGSATGGSAGMKVYFVSLDSSGGKLVLVEDSAAPPPAPSPCTTPPCPTTVQGAVQQGAVVVTVWQCSGACFLKGLAVVGDTAYFGRSAAPVVSVPLTHPTPHSPHHLTTTPPSQSGIVLVCTMHYTRYALTMHCTRYGLYCTRYTLCYQTGRGRGRNVRCV
jgi:hypothetical protein